MKKRILAISGLAALSFLMLLGCGTSADPVPAASDWGPCPDYTLFDDAARCARVPAPLDYQNPSGEKISIFVYRTQGASPNKKGQVWFLEGGPGGAGIVLWPRIAYLARLYPEFDFYSFDHRGVGGSARIGCPGDNEFLNDPVRYNQCLDEIVQTRGADLAHFTTTNAAQDLHQLISRYRGQDQNVFIYGTSYGTYWLLRYLQLYPDQVQGVILDSVCSPGDCYLDEFDGWNNLVGLQFLELCGKDPICDQKMAAIASDPAAAMEAVFEKLDQGQLCPELEVDLDRTRLRIKLSKMLQNWSGRILVPALIYRLNRCSDSDRQAILNLFNRSAPLPPEGLDPYVAPMLADYVALSEMYGGKTLAQARATAEAAFFSEDQSLRFAALYEQGRWPLYNDPEYAQKFPKTNVPMLMMNGTTDPQTPLEMAVKSGQYFTGPSQTFVTLPFATHGVIQHSPLDRPWPLGLEPCGSNLMGQFINNPQEPLDESCTSQVYPVEFDPSSENNRKTSLTYFGTDDMWEGAPDN